MLEKILNKLGYIKKNKYDSLGNEFQKLAQTFGETQKEKEKMEALATSLVLYPHTIFKDVRGNYIPLPYSTLKETEGYKLKVKTDIYNQTILRVERKELNKND